MLNVDIPVVDFLSNVNASLDNDDVDWVDSSEVSAVEADSWGVHGAHT